MNELWLRNRQRIQPIDTALLRRIAEALAVEASPKKEFRLGVVLLSAPQMARLNESFLHHAGSTDVITFDYSEPGQTGMVQGEIFIGVEDAIRQARQFRGTWQSELTRYLVHGWLHLLGFDDLSPADRRVMKRQENRLLRSLARRFPLHRLARSSKVAFKPCPSTSERPA